MKVKLSTNCPLKFTRSIIDFHNFYEDSQIKQATGDIILKGFLKNFSKITREDLLWSVLSVCIFAKQELYCSCFPQSI